MRRLANLFPNQEDQEQFEEEVAKFYEAGKNTPHQTSTVLPKLRAIQNAAQVLRKLESNPDRRIVLDDIIASAQAIIDALGGNAGHTT